MASKRNSVNMRLAKSILHNEGMPSDCLSVTPIQLFDKLTQLEVIELKGGKEREKAQKVQHNH